MTGSGGRGVEPDVTLGEFLQAQANTAGLSARDMSERFQNLADQETSRIQGGAQETGDPLSGMSFSKSHLDRLYKGVASLPSIRFLRIFLEITSRAADIHPEQHRELCRRAEDFLVSARRHRRRHRATSPKSMPQTSTDVTVATLHMQLEIERAQRTEDRLRWALSDTQVLMGTLLQIISALREIIVDIDIQLAKILRAADRPDTQELAERQRREAQSYKAAAEAQFDLANQRRRLLEILWDQAHGNLQRLTLHADVADIASLPDGPALPPQQILPEDLLTRPALADIASALGKVREHNDTEEHTAIELQHTVMSDTPLEPNDELAILVAATRLTDANTRGTALHALLKNWPLKTETREALVRLSRDEQPAIRLTTASSLAASWKGDAAARDALVALTQDSNPDARQTAVMGLAEGWAGDAVARDALVALTQDSNPDARQTAVMGLAEGWAGDAVARDALAALTQDSNVLVRMTVAESLVDSWPADAPARIALHTLSHDAAATVRWAVQHVIATHDDHCSKRSQEAEQNSSLLLAIRAPASHTTLKPPLLDILRRGIAFDAGVTVLVGDNAAGKTVTLNALALSIPQVVTDGSLRNVSSISRQLADDLEVVWNKQRAPEAIFYLNGLHLERRGSNSLASGMENWMEQWNSQLDAMKGPNRLILLDEPIPHFDRSAHRLIFERLNEFVNEGCQFIIVSVRDTWAEMTDARVIRIDKRVRRKFLPDQTHRW
ncbi:HEAT repeat domain-containing protein [Streptomyces anulatus]